MVEFNERCILIEKSYRENLNRLKDAYEELINSVDDPEQRKEIDDTYNDYLDDLLTEDDLDNINNDKDRIYDEYKEIEDLSNDNDNDVSDKADGIKDIITKSDIQPETVTTSPDNKISDYNKNMDESKVIKDNEADNFSKMLENFRYSTSPNQKQQTIPSIHVAPVQVINFDQEKILEKNVNKLVKSALDKYKLGETTQDEINKLIEPVAEEAVGEEVGEEAVAEEAVAEEAVAEAKKLKKPVSKKKTKKKKNLRSFTIFNISRNLNCKEELNEGRYRAKDPQSAARKAFNRYCNRTNQKEKECNYFLTVKETTRGSNGDLNTYKMMRIKLAKPVVRFAGTPKEYLNKYDTEMEPVQTPKSCYRNKLGNKSKKNN